MYRKNFDEWSCNKRGETKYTLSGTDSRRWYQRDIDQITHSIGFRKLQKKSQLLSEKDPRSRSRLIHTIEVSRIAMEISERLGLSKELTEAISLGHDIGTSPYGCIGNKFLQNKVCSEFSHEHVGSLMLTRISQKETNNDEEFSRIAQVIHEKTNGFVIKESNGTDFELKVSMCSSEDGEKYFIHHISPEVLDGVKNHGEGGKPQTLEGQVVKFADNIAYLSQDIEDLFSTKIIAKSDGFVRKASAKQLYFLTKDKDTGKEIKREMLWENINSFSDCKLNNAFNLTRGKRIASFVDRFVDYNLKMLNEEKMTFEFSSILGKNIPQLQCDYGLNFIIDYLWNFIESNYSDMLISTSNSIQEAKMEQLWKILNDDKFKEKNKYYKKFLNEISQNTLFSGMSNDWKTAYFISHLSWFEVDLIIDSFHERNYNFDLDLD